MIVMTHLRTKISAWLIHPGALYYLALLSFIESIFFPLPPDLMLVPMSLRCPSRAHRYALVTVLASALGGICGYMIGCFLTDLVMVYLRHHDSTLYIFCKIKQCIDSVGGIYVLIGAVTPIPYKLVTITAGLMKVNFIQFVIFSLLGRCIRFYSISLVLSHCDGPRLNFILKHWRIIGWVLLVTTMVILMPLYFLRVM